MLIQRRTFPRGEFTDPEKLRLGLRITTSRGVFDITDINGEVKILTPEGILRIAPESANCVAIDNADLGPGIRANRCEWDALLTECRSALEYARYYVYNEGQDTAPIDDALAHIDELIST